MLNAIGDSLSAVASSKEEEDGDDEDDGEEDTELGKLSEDDEPGWVMGTISNTVQHGMESDRQNQRRVDDLTRPGQGNAADYICDKDMKYGMTELKNLAVVKPQTDTTGATPSPASFGELLQAPANIPWQSRMPQVTSWPASSQMRLGSEKPPAEKHMVSLMPDAVRDSSQMEIAKPDQRVSI